MFFKKNTVPPSSEEPENDPLEKIRLQFEILASMAEALHDGYQAYMDDILQIRNSLLSDPSLVDGLNDKVLNAQAKYSKNVLVSAGKKLGMSEHFILNTQQYTLFSPELVFPDGLRGEMQTLAPEVFCVLYFAKTWSQPDKRIALDADNLMQNKISQAFDEIKSMSASAMNGGE